MLNPKPWLLAVAAGAPVLAIVSVSRFFTGRSQFAFAAAALLTASAFWVSFKHLSDARYSAAWRAFFAGTLVWSVAAPFLPFFHWTLLASH